MARDAMNKYAIYIFLFVNLKFQFDYNKLQKP